MPTPSVRTLDIRALACEIKFLVDPDTGARIREWVRNHLEPDPHGTGACGDAYRTTSVYFDTASFDVYRRQGSNGRTKYRIRRYGRESTVFLERKLRRDGLLIKRRAVVGLDDIGRLEHDVDRDWPGAWFHRRVTLRRLRPVCQISYDRVARVTGRGADLARLTLDQAASARPVDDITLADGQGSAVLPGRLVLEMKYRGTLPALFKHLVEEFALTPQPFSKYRCAVETLQLASPAATTDAPGATGARYA